MNPRSDFHRNPFDLLRLFAPLRVVIFHTVTRRVERPFPRRERASGAPGHRTAADHPYPVAYRPASDGPVAAAPHGTVLSDLNGRRRSPPR